MRLAARFCAVTIGIVVAGAGLGQTIIVDNSDPGFSILSGTWGGGAYGVPYGADYNHAVTTSAGGAPAEAEWRPDLPHAGEYEVAIYYVAGTNRAEDSPFTVHHVGGPATTPVNQQINSSTWIPLGRFSFDAGTSGRVTLNNAAGPSYVIADAVRFTCTDGMVFYDDPLLRIGGALFSRVEGYAMRLDRIDPLLLANPGDLFSPSVAVLTTGVTVGFRTDSASIQANFNHLSYVVTENTGYVVFQNGVFDRLVNELEIVDITSTQPGTPVTYEIVCPSYDEVTFNHLQIETGASVYQLPGDRRPRYFAFGDSITHGSEIDADTKGDSTAAYPWLLADAKGWRLYNLAVGGSKVTPDFGTMLAGGRADVITILWGLNDKARDNDLPLYISKYEALLDNLRAAQPRTPIHCMTMIACSGEGPGVNGYTLDDYRDAIASIVAARQAAGDCRLHLVRGEELTTLADLSDGSHFSVPGAANFVEGLLNVIGAPWGDFDDDGDWDADDWASLADCLAGPVVIPPGGPCAGGDYDCDADVDLREIAAFQVRFGP